jgi:diguanylate cyclase (GGDEF)-like protein
MKHLIYQRHRIPPHFLLVLIFAAYIAVFIFFHDEAGYALGSLAVIPIMVASWFYGVRGGIFVAVLSIIINTLIFSMVDHSSIRSNIILGNLVGTFSLILVAIVVGGFAAALQQRRDAILKLEQYERARQSHTQFLELLNEITARALAADSLQSTLEILTEKLAHLFQADDAFLTFWDAAKELPIPTVAYGSMKDIYPYIQFEPGDTPPTTLVMQAERTLFIEDIDNSPSISPKVAAIFPSRSMLCIPLIAQGNKLGAILLGYNKKRTLDEEDIQHSNVVAEQVSLVLSKSLLLEDERRQVRQLTALHDVALVSTEADNEDQLIERVTDIIGQNLFPDNFGIMLLDEQTGILHAHPSYRFYLTEDLTMPDVCVGTGVTGKVAQSGQPQRIDNVRRIAEYIDMDDSTISELCVPIKFKERVLGVINAESTKKNAFTLDDERLLVTLAGQLATAIEQLRKAQAERIILDQLAHDKDLIYSIAQITTQIERSLNPEEIIQTMGNELEKINITCIMAMYEQERRSFTVNYTSMPPHLLEIVDAGLGYPLLQYGFSSRKLDLLLKMEHIQRPTVISNPADEIRAIFHRINKRGIPAILEKIGVVNGIEPLRLPLTFEDRLQGVLWVWGKNITHSDLPIMSIFAKQIGITLERARLFQEVQSLALTDPLTGLQNRRSLFELGRIEFSRAQRMKRPFSCMMLDIDHFKFINDKHGHQIGDQVLQEFGTRCKAYVREIDLAGRYGGEEFMILLPETDRDMALIVAERFRTLIAENPIQTTVGHLTITVSIGVSMKDEQTLDLDTLVARADQALYIAKHKGRNRVSTSF